MNDLRTRRGLLGYLLLCALYLLFTLLGLHLAKNVAKPLLMPALALAVWPRAPRLLIGAVLASCLGDTMLMFGGSWFLVGMGGFAAAHVCYITLFVRGGALRTPNAGGGTRGRLALGGYALVWAVLITLLWPDLAAGLRIPVACYSLLLAGMAATSMAAGARTGLGGGLFLLSDSLIATGLAHWPQLPAADFCIMLTYLAGQYLLVTGALGRTAEAGNSAPGLTADPTAPSLAPQSSPA
ncbi:lysoplasmalogenase [Streptacidiphilus rugosus]|uniref:lysoplasmalogenase n=1 Tax=Streptacidiphilus rugosus TaxID=405783 RepID=UPI0007C72117|nr:lysoplasmalogenase [Streptacidiphilus rugosus]